MLHAGARLSSGIALLLLLAVMSMLGACKRPGPDFDTHPALRLGVYEWPGNYWIDVAWQKGWFAAEGLRVERIDAEGKYFESLDAVVAGRIDMIGFSQFDLVRYVASGHDLIGVAAIDYSDGAEALVARPDIHSLRELQGKRIALHRGTYLEYLLHVAAERAEIDADEFQLFERSEAAAIADLKAGRVDAAFLWEPYATQAQTAIKGVRLFSTADLPGLSYNVLALPRHFVTARPAEISALLRVWKRATRFVLEHPSETCDMIARAYHQLPEEPCALMRTDRILDIADNMRAFSYAAGFESLHSSWRRMNDFMVESRMTQKRVESPAHLDSRFIASLD